VCCWRTEHNKPVPEGKMPIAKTGYFGFVEVDLLIKPP